MRPTATRGRRARLRELSAQETPCRSRARQAPPRRRHRARQEPQGASSGIRPRQGTGGPTQGRRQMLAMRCCKRRARPPALRRLRRARVAATGSGTRRPATGGLPTVAGARMPNGPPPGGAAVGAASSARKMGFACDADSPHPCRAGRAANRVLQNAAPPTGRPTPPARPPGGACGAAPSCSTARRPAGLAP